MRSEICIIGGGGHVGLPLSIAFAGGGKVVTIYDINTKNLQKIENGNLPFYEKDAEEKLQSVIGKTLFTSDSPEVISEADFVIVIIGTPVDEHLNPRFQDMKNFFDTIIPYLRDGQILILRSTVYPGLTEKTRKILQSKYPNIEVCFCPERIAEGEAMRELHSLPQIVSGFNDTAVKKTAELFKSLTEDIIYLSPLEAELAKLFTNSWRYIQFAIANQFYMIAENSGLDFYKIYDAMTFNYPRAKGFPKPGWTAGPCLFKDTMQISAFAKNNFFLGHSAMLINEGLPNFIIDNLKKGSDLEFATVGILGMAFKADSDDKRESLSYKLKKILEIEAKKVYCSDAYIKDERFISEDKMIEKCDIIIIGAPHKRYKQLDYKNKEVIDIWGLISLTNDEK
jgi:UDP-N-acetyl-D-mannosaminuronic acid dehydrogenase